MVFLALASALLATAPAAEPPAALPVLTAIEQIRSLTPEQATQRHPVRIRGVITLQYPAANIVIQDAAEGLWIKLNAEPPDARIGQRVLVEGVTGPGDFLPIVEQAHILETEPAALPNPEPLAISARSFRQLDCRWVEVSGIIRSVFRNPNRDFAAFCELDAGSSHLTVQILWGAQQPLPTNWIDAAVTFRGVSMSEWNRKRQLRGFSVTVPSQEYLTVTEPAPEDPFAIPLHPISAVMQSGGEEYRGHRSRVQGEVLYLAPGRALYLRDATGGFLAQTQDKQPLEPGAIVDVIGFPERGEYSPFFKESSYRKIRAGTPAAAIPVTATNLLAGQHDADLVSLEARLLGVTPGMDRDALILETDRTVFTAEVAGTRDPLNQPRWVTGSRLRLIGIAQLKAEPTTDASIQSFQLLVRSSRDIVVLQRGPWWTFRHTMVVVAALATVLVLACAWISQLRRRVEIRTRQLQEEVQAHERTEAELNDKARLLEEKTSLLAAEIERRKQAQSELEQQKVALENEIEERKRTASELERAQKQLASMAQVATSVLHNVGNVLNSVNISATLATDRVKQLRIANLTKLADLLTKHAQVPDFLAAHEKGKQVPGYLRQLSESLTQEQAASLQELHSLRQNVDHIKEIVTLQQGYARLSGLTEPIKASQLIEDAVRLNAGSHLHPEIELIRDYRTDDAILVEKHKVLLVLVNLIQNAKRACQESTRPDKKLTLRIVACDSQRIQIQVADNGIGIPAENLAKIFTHGFTTRAQGHGFGLHSSLNAVRDMGGSLTVHSDGPNQGTTFTLELPVSPAVSPPGPSGLNNKLGGT